MSTLQYIGARYVPKFFENPDDGTMNWKSGVAYEPLVVVTYQDDTYTSRKTVPASVGDPASNPTYWAMTGNFNAALAALQNTVGDIVNNHLPAIEQSIDDIDEVTPLNGDYIVFIGDSYTGANSLGADIDKRYSTLLSARLGLVEKNYAVGGSGFTGGNRKYQLQAQDAVDDFTNNDLDFDKVKYFVIGGTRNDKNTITYSDYNTEVRATLYKIYSNFPNAKVIILELIYSAYFMPQYYLRNKGWLESIVAQYGEVGVTCIDCHDWLTGHFNDILYESGANVHPTISGHKILAQHAYSAIMGNNYDQASGGEVYHNGFPNDSAIYRNGSQFVVNRMHGMLKYHFQVQILDYTLVPANTTLYDHTYNMSQIDSYFLGNQNLKVALNDGTRIQIATTINKTGDTTGTAQITVTNLDAFASNGVKIADGMLIDGVLSDPNDI